MLKRITSHPQRRRLYQLGGALALAVSSVLVTGLAFRTPSGEEAMPEPAAASAAAKPAVESKEAKDLHLQIGEAGKDEFARLFLAILEIKDPAERNRLLTALTQRWMEKDLKGFVAFIDAMEVNGAVPGGLWKVLAPVLAEVLPKLQPPIATGPAIRELVRRLVEYWSETDPTKALAWANEYLQGDALDSARAVIAPALAQTSRPQAEAVLATITMAVRRVEAIDGIGDALARRDSADALDWAARLENPAEQPYAMGSVLAAMAAREPVAAATEFNRYRQQMNMDYAAQWARDYESRPLNSAELVEGNLAPGEIPAVPQNPQLHLLNDAAAAIAENWGHADPASAVAWVEGFKEGKMKYDAMSSVLGGWASVDGTAAFSYYAPYAAAQPVLAETLFREWASVEPALAAEQVGRIADPTAQQNAASGVIAGWLAHGGDLAELERWADALPMRNARDVANAELVAAVSMEQPFLAWQRALQIQATQPRGEAMQVAFASLVEQDPRTAGHALASAKLPEAELESLQLMLEAAGGQLQ